MALVGLVGFTISISFFFGVAYGTDDPTIVYKVALATSIECGLLFMFAWGYRIGLSLLGAQPCAFYTVYFIVGLVLIICNPNEEMTLLLWYSTIPVTICFLMIIQLPHVFEEDIKELKGKSAILVACTLYGRFLELFR